MENVGQKPDGSRISGRWEGEMQPGRGSSSLKRGERWRRDWKESGIMKGCSLFKFCIF